jgi:Major Facilitator Superfamily
LSRGNTKAAIEAVNRMIARSGGRIAPLTIAELGTGLETVREALPPIKALFGPGQLRWTLIGTACFAVASTAYYCSAILLPKALIDQGAAVSLSFGLSTLLFMVTIPGKFFTGFIMEIIGRRWTITYCFVGALPGLALMALAHRTGDYATVAMSAGVIITGMTVLSSFTAVRVYLSEQFPTALRGRGHFFGEAIGGDGRRLRPATVRQGDRRPARNSHRGGARAAQGVSGHRSTATYIDSKRSDPPVYQPSRLERVFKAAKTLHLRSRSLQRADEMIE